MDDDSDHYKRGLKQAAHVQVERMCFVFFSLAISFPAILPIITFREATIPDYLWICILLNR
jgi:hypothetical protein